MIRADHNARRRANRGENAPSFDGAGHNRSVADNQPSGACVAHAASQGHSRG